MSIIYDVEDIAARMNRKPEPVAAVAESTDSPASHVAAIRTLLHLGYTYTPGAQQWKPPIGEPSAAAEVGPTAAMIEAKQAMFQNLRNWVRENDEKRKWQAAKERCFGSRKMTI